MINWAIEHDDNRDTGENLEIRSLTGLPKWIFLHGTVSILIIRYHVVARHIACGNEEKGPAEEESEDDREAERR